MTGNPHDIYVGTDGQQEYLLTVWDDGTREVATRPHSCATWGPPVELTRQTSEVSQ